jgi:uncharacterized protein (DUF885 family)
MVVVAGSLACGGRSTELEGPARRALDIAEAYVDGFYRQFPEEAYESAYPGAPRDRLGDRSLSGLADWEAREDGWLEELRALDPDRLAGTEAEIPYAYALERLASSVERRVCRTELWNVSPTWTGWQSVLAAVFAQQPVGTPAHRTAALSRARDVPRYIRTEIDNLREGLALGYTTPRTNVQSVLEQLEALLGAPLDSSPFFDPAVRDEDPAFQNALREVIEAEIAPAVSAYRDFLAAEYQPQAREAAAVSEDPGGLACYQASVRFWTSLTISPKEIHDIGEARNREIQIEVAEIGERSFGQGFPRVIFDLARNDSTYRFHSEEEILAYNRAAAQRARDLVPLWFGFVPEAEVVIRPFPEFQKASGGGFYSAAAEDGSRPGTFELGTFDPTSISKVGAEATAFHETYPGHHMQMSVAQERGRAHPVVRYFYDAGFGEGWALYTERLADEMKLYSSEFDRLGMLSNEALRAARLVVDAGIHALGWSRQQAIDYMVQYTAESEATIVSEVDRYIAVPGQATSYLLGSLEIQRLRRLAEERLGDRFDIRVFHDRVLENGAIHLGLLRKRIEHWIEAGGPESDPARMQ